METQHRTSLQNRNLFMHFGLAFLLLCSFGQSANAGWQYISSTPSSTNKLLIDPVTPTTLYALHDLYISGLYKSVDGGQNWISIGDTIVRPGESTIRNVHNLAIDPLNPNILFAGTDNGLFKSTDAGENWTYLTFGKFLSVTANPMTSSLYVLYSTDYFREYAYDGTLLKDRLSMGIGGTSLTVDPVTPTTIYIGDDTFWGGDWDGNTYIVSPGRVLSSIDGGDTWSTFFESPELLTNSDVRSVVIDPSDTDIIYVAADTIYKTVDGGNNWAELGGWTALGIGTSPSLLTLDPRSPNTLYATVNSATKAAIYKSMDGGASWNPFDVGIPGTVNNNPQDFVFDPGTPDNVIAMGWYGNTYKYKPAFPEPLEFTYLRNIAYNTPVTSEISTIKGLVTLDDVNVDVDISIIGGEYSINGGEQRRTTKNSKFIDKKRCQYKHKK